MAGFMFRKGNNSPIKFSRTKSKKKACDLAKYRDEVNRGQNDLWNACLPYMDAQEYNLSLGLKIVPKAVEVVNDVKTKNRLLLEEKNKLKLTQVKLLKTLISKLKKTTNRPIASLQRTNKIGMPARRKKRQSKKTRWIRKKPGFKLPSNTKFENFKGFSNFEFSLSERYKEILASLDEKKSYSSTDTDDEATFSGFESADDEICASSFYGFDNSSVLNKNVIDGRFSPSLCTISYKISDSIPDLKFVFPPLKNSCISENVPIVKKSPEAPLRKGIKRTNSGSFQVQPTTLEPTVRIEYLSEPFVKSAQEPPVAFIKSGMPKKDSKEKGNLQTIPTLIDGKNDCSKLQSFMVKSEANNKNSLKFKIIRNAEMSKISDSDAVNSNFLPRSYVEAKRIKREVKHPGKYAAYVTNNSDFKMLKNRLQNRKGKLKGKLSSEFEQYKESISVSQEPRISPVLLDIHSADVKKENTFPSTNENGRLIKSVSYSPINGKNKIQRKTLNSLSVQNKKSCHSNYVKSNKPMECPSFLKENQNILADKLAYLNDIYKRNGCEVSIIKLDKSMDVKRKQLNKETIRPNFQYGEYINNSAQISNVVKDRSLNRGDSVLELNRQILKKRLSAPCLSTSFTSDDEVSINDNLNKTEYHSQGDVHQGNTSTVTTKDYRFAVSSGSGLREMESIANGFSTPSPFYSSNVKRGYPYKIVPRAASASKPPPKMPTLIPYYSLTSANINNTILSESKLPKLTNAVNLQKKTLKADIESYTKVGLPFAKDIGYVDSTNQTMTPYDNYTFMNDKNPPIKTYAQSSNVLLSASQGHCHLPTVSLDETDKRVMEDNGNHFSANVVKTPILQKQHKCSNCGFVTTKLGVFKRHQLIHSEANFMSNTNAGNNVQLPKHTSPVKEVLPACKDVINVKSTITTSASLNPRNYEQRVKSLLMPIKDTPMPMLPNERLFLKSWTRIEKLELMWCYYYSCCNVFPEEDVVGRLKSTLFKRGKISIDKISSDCLLKIVYSILSANKVRAQDLYPIKINAEITARKEHLYLTRLS